ncbi:hypothetical protein Hamer_G029260 [Homarus americanus]|uniref:Uncharacterized protein n=1 Tax=Homarus americanus TaxID=6706 RepID=A0A8J5N5P8_HOMAM|nr:hypothetical protein Hamer_G029260 [Homarus americanus]
MPSHTQLTRPLLLCPATPSVNQTVAAMPTPSVNQTVAAMRPHHQLTRPLLLCSHTIVNQTVAAAATIS